MTSLSFARAAAVPTYDRVAGQSAALVIRGYSTSFGVASRLLAEPVRTHVRNIYALVRIADEIVDDPSAGFDTVERADQLDRLEDFFVRALGVVVEAVELRDPAMQVGEPHVLRIDIDMLVREGHCDFPGVRPLHGCSLLLSGFPSRG